MNKFAFLLCFVCLLLNSFWAFSQEKIDKSIQVMLEQNSRPYPVSFLIRDNDQKLNVNAEFKIADYQRSYQPKELELEEFDYIKLIDRKKRFRNSIIGSLLFGTAAYLIADNSFKSSDNPNINLVATNDISVIQNTIVATISAGIGFVIGRSIGSKKMNIKEQKEEVIRKLELLGY